MSYKEGEIEYFISTMDPVKWPVLFLMTLSNSNVDLINSKFKHGLSNLVPLQRRNTEEAETKKLVKTLAILNN